MPTWGHFACRFTGYHRGAAPWLEFGPKDFNYKVEQQDAQSFSEEQLTALMESAKDCCRAARERREDAGGGSTKLLQKQYLAALRDRTLLALLIATGSSQSSTARARDAR